MPKHLSPKNAPIFPGPSDENEGGSIKANCEFPMSGPEGMTAGEQPGLSNLKGLHQNQQGRDPSVSDVPFPAPIQDSDFPDKSTFTKGTKRHLDTSGMI